MDRDERPCPPPEGLGDQGEKPQDPAAQGDPQASAAEDMSQGAVQLAPLDGVEERAPDPALAGLASAGRSRPAVARASGPPPTWEEMPSLELAFRPGDRPPDGTRYSPTREASSRGTSLGASDSEAGSQLPGGHSGAGPHRLGESLESRAGVPGQAHVSVVESPAPDAAGAMVEARRVEAAARRARRRLLYLLGGLGASVVLAGLWYGLGLGEDTPRHTASWEREDEAIEQTEGQGVAAEVEAPAQEVRLIFEVTPRQARLLVRGHEAPGHMLLAPYAETPFTVRFEAKGYAPKDVAVTPNRSQRIRVRLDPLPKALHVKQ